MLDHEHPAALASTAALTPDDTIQLTGLRFWDRTSGLHAFLLPPDTRSDINDAGICGKYDYWSLVGNF